MKDTTWKNGDFCWVDLMTTDLPKAKEFYSKILNWTYEEVNTPNGPYIFSNISEGNVGGLGLLPEEMQKQGIPSYWSTYVKVENADASVAKAKELGGKVQMEAFDVMDIGRMAVISSPSGATLCVWEAKNKEVDTPRTSGHHHGMYGWVELNTHNLDADGKFYCDLFDWTPKTSQMEGGPNYTEFKSKDADYPVAGMIEIQKEWGEMPSCWTLYFSVNNIDDAVKEIEANGGSICMKPFEVKNVGRMGVAQDPTGATFCFAQWDFSSKNC